MPDKPNITILDGFTLNPGDLSWDALKAIGPLDVHDRTPPELVRERSLESEVVFTNKALLPGDVIRALPKLRYIGVLATGYNVVDVQAAVQQGVTVTNIPDYGSQSVAQHTWALILELTNHVGSHDQAVREGRWQSSKDFCFWDSPLTELDGRKLGIIGFGSIGRAVAKVGVAMGMEVLVHSRTRPDVLPDQHRWCTLEETCREADVVSLHCPLTSSNKEFINADLLRQMKKSALLVNTSRGPLIQETDLAEALRSGEIAGAAVDVLSKEAPTGGNILIGAPNLIVTPHIAWATHAARSRLMKTAVSNLQGFLRGNPVNVVQP